MAPATSYWPPTRSPACSLGVNENGLRHCAQNPSVRPGWPSRERPTAAPHDGHDPLVLGDLRVLQDRLGGVDRGDRRHGGQPGAEAGAAQAGRGGADPPGDARAAAPGPGRAEGGGRQPVGGARDGRGRVADPGGRRRRRSRRAGALAAGRAGGVPDGGSGGGSDGGLPQTSQ